MPDKFIHELPKEESIDAWVASIPECCKKCENASWHSVVTIREQGAIMDCPIMCSCEKRMEALCVVARNERRRYL